MTEERFPRTVEAVESAVSREPGGAVTPGLSAGVWLKSRPDHYYGISLGWRRLVPSEQPLEKETVFDLASLTKVLATAALAADLVERGWLRWNQPVKSILEGYPHDGITVAHLLSHTAGLPAWFPYWEKLQERYGSVSSLVHENVKVRQKLAREMTFAVDPETKPGERTLYSDVSFLLLGYVLEELTGGPLDRAVHHHVWDPMGVRGLHFRRVDRGAEAGRDEKFAATEDSEWRGGVLQGQVHDDNCWAMGGYGGHAGVFGAVRDVLFFSREILKGHFSREVTRAMCSRVTEPAGCERTLGWDTPTEGSASCGRHFSPASFGHLGFTGTSLWIDPEAGLAVTLLTNRVHPSRENERIREFRPRFHDAVREDLAAGALRR